MWRQLIPVNGAFDDDPVTGVTLRANAASGWSGEPDFESSSQRVLPSPGLCYHQAGYQPACISMGVPE